MSFYFPDQMVHGVPGNLLPRRVEFDPGRAAHLSWERDGSLRFRVVTEAGLTEAALVLADGSLHPMEAVLASSRTRVWEVRLEGPPEEISFTFAFRTDDGLPVYRVPAGISNAVERLDRWRVHTADVPRIDVPEWARGTVVYQIFPERFRNGDPGLSPDGAVPWGSDPAWLDFQGGDLPGIAGKAGYLAGLGVGLVYLNPIFASPSTHRYDAADYYAVAPALGGNEALDGLRDALAEHGIRLIVDASFNHCHPAFFAFADVVERGEASAYASWFVVEDWPPRVIFRPAAMAAAGFRDPGTYRQYLERFAAESGVQVLEQDDDGPPVETTYEAWYGVPSLPRIDLSDPDARRYFLDVARHWVTEHGIDGWRMDVARYVDFDFWPDFRRAVKEAAPDAYLLAEIMGDATPWLQGDTFDATMNYTFRQVALDFLATGRIDAADAADALVRMYAALPPAIADVCQNLIGSHDTARFLHEAKEDADRLLLATVLQMTLPGAPGIYYGDEIGMTGGEEPASRGPFPWDDESSWDHRQLGAVRELGALRRRYAALGAGALEIVAAEGATLAYTRSLEDDRILVVIARGGGSATLPLDPEGAETLFGTGSCETVAGALQVDVPAPGAWIARL